MVLPESQLSGFCAAAKCAHLAPDAVAGASQVPRPRAVTALCSRGRRSQTHGFHGWCGTSHGCCATRPAVNGARGLQQMTADLRRELREQSVKDSDLLKSNMAADVARAAKIGSQVSSTCCSCLGRRGPTARRLRAGRPSELLVERYAALV